MSIIKEISSMNSIDNSAKQKSINSFQDQVNDICAKAKGKNVLVSMDTLFCCVLFVGFEA